MPLAVDAARADNGDGLRRAAVAAIGRIGELVETERTHAVEAIDERLDDAAFQVQIAALAAAESLGDARLLPTLDRLSQAAFDGRVRRDAMEAAIRVREAAKVPGQVSAMRGDIDELREEQRKLQEKIETLSRIKRRCSSRDSARRGRRWCGGLLRLRHSSTPAATVAIATALPTIAPQPSAAPWSPSERARLQTALSDAFGATLAGADRYSLAVLDAGGRPVFLDRADSAQLRRRRRRSF